MKPIYSLLILQLAWLFVAKTSAQNIRVMGNCVISIKGNAQLSVPGNITLEAGSAIQNNGTLALSGNWVNNGNGFSATDTGKVMFKGAAPQTIGGSSITEFNKITIDSKTGLQGVTQTIDTKVKGEMKLDGRYYVDNSSLIFDRWGDLITSSSFADSRCIIPSTASARVKKGIDSSPLNIFFPLGDTTGSPKYAPIQVSLILGNASEEANVSVGMKGVKHPNNSNTTNYLNRYWTVSQSGLSGFSADVTATYTEGDIVGTQSNMATAQWNGSVWTEFGAVNSPLKTLNATVSSFGDFSGLTLIPTTKIRASICGTTLPATSTTIYADAVAGATLYRFRVSNGGVVQIYDTPNSYFKMTNITYAFSSTYTVDVATQVNGVFSAYGTACNITTPNAPLTRLRDDVCGIVLPTMNTTIYAVIVPTATNYIFKVTNGANVQFYQTANSWFRMTFLPIYLVSTTYTVEVATEVNGVFGAYGSPCTITTPIAKMEEAKSELDIIQDWVVNAYPNPFSNTITLSHNATGHDVNIRMMDMLGKVVYETTTTAFEITMGNGLSKGMYHISVEVGGQRKELKGIKN